MKSKSSKPDTTQRSFADDPQRNPMRDENADENRELFMNNPEHPLKVAVREGKSVAEKTAAIEDTPDPLFHPKPIPESGERVNSKEKPE